MENAEKYLYWGQLCVGVINARGIEFKDTKTFCSLFEALEGRVWADSIVSRTILTMYNST
jgi:hypothetical protein